MVVTATFEIWLLGHNEAYSSLLNQHLGRNPDYRLRRFATVPRALASAQEGERPEAIIFDCGPAPDGSAPSRAAATRAAAANGYFYCLEPGRHQHGR